MALNLALFVLLLGYTIDTGPASTWVTLIAVLVLSFRVRNCLPEAHWPFPGADGATAGGELGALLGQPQLGATPTNCLGGVRNRAGARG